MPDATTTTPPMSRGGRAGGALVAALAAASLLLQYGLLVAPASAGDIPAATVLFLGYFTILSNLLVLAVCAAAVRGGRGVARWLQRPRVQGAAALCIGMTGLVYGTVLHGLWQPQGLQWWADTGLHRLVPVAYLAWWAGAAAHGRLGLRDVAWWLPFPAAYLLVTLVRGHWTHVYPYPFLDVGVHGLSRVLANALVVAAVFVVLGLLLLAADRLLGRRGPR